MRREHPLLQETDCKGMADVLQFERQHRDSLMHPTPKVQRGRPVQREEVYYDITRQETGRIIDAVIEVIERIDKELNGLFGRVSLWVVKRGEDNRFPDTAFH